MNNDAFEVYKFLRNKKYTQRELSKLTSFSLGKINKIMQDLNSETINPNDYKVKNAIILAAGFGLRMIPINQTPKALLKIKKEILIERLIKQLHNAGINDIVIVVGFMKEKFEYLIDKYNVKLFVNSEYYNDSNSKSLCIASKIISNTYIVPGDLYFMNNPFADLENDSWYMLSNEKATIGYYFTDEKRHIIKGKNVFYNAVGLAYINYKDSQELVSNLENVSKNEFSFWEDSFFVDKAFKIKAKFINPEDYFEINTYEQLRLLDRDSESLKNEHMEIISKCFNVETKEIKNVATLKKGMTNRSFLFEIGEEKYIMRIPGEGTDKLINRENEYQVYKRVSELSISDSIVYFNPDNGVKITRFIKNARVCDAHNDKELFKCIKFLKNFHEKKIVVPHTFDLFGQINYYENLFGGVSLYEDYSEIKKCVLDLKKYIEAMGTTQYLTHIDAVPDNFLIDDNENIRLIDWEYAGMQDTHVDLAMFSIYAGYEKKDIDKIIDIYFDNSCLEKTRYKIYAYVAICGLLWSNWCEYKKRLGVEFGEYSLMQYRYAKVYSKIALNYFGKENI